MYIFFNVILPIAYEVMRASCTPDSRIQWNLCAFQYDPDLVLVSAGYDVALGCPEVPLSGILCLDSIE